MFFSPSRAVLSAILRDEYLTLAVGTKEGDSFFSSKDGRWVPGSETNKSQGVLKYFFTKRSEY